jgi:hypothetical protein
MNPAIYTAPHTLTSYLVDEDSEIRMKWRMPQCHARSFETAVQLSCFEPVTPGAFECHSFADTPQAGVKDGNVSVIAPTPEIMEAWPERRKYSGASQNFVIAPAPCVYGFENEILREGFHSQRRTYSDPAGREVCRGIHKPAAGAMLRLAASWNNFKHDRVTESYSFGHHRIESTAPSLPWDKWAFLCAWFWSDWENRSHQKRITQAQRFEEMKAAGYPHGSKAFEALHRRLFPKPTH